MATQTTNLGLTKPGYDEAADIVPAVNNNMDAIDAVMGAVPPNTSVQAQITANAQAIAKLDESIAIVSNGNTHAAIAAGQYVYIKGHETLAEGLYTANSAISANATLSNSNVTAVSGGGLNALNSKFANKSDFTVINVQSYSFDSKAAYAEILANLYTYWRGNVYAQFSNGINAMCMVLKSNNYANILAIFDDDYNPKIYIKTNSSDSLKTIPAT